MLAKKYLLTAKFVVPLLIKDSFKRKLYPILIRVRGLVYVGGSYNKSGTLDFSFTVNNKNQINLSSLTRKSFFILSLLDDDDV